MAVRQELVADRYRLLEPVGAGGMGRVWLARDEMLHRDVAVKEIVPPEWMSDVEQHRLHERTLREARSAARLNHPHVVRIYDVVHTRGQSWIVMEYVPSRSLYQVLNEDGPYEPAVAARIGLALLDALAAAHRAGVLHRDVKPHNVLIGTDGRVVLTDFGLATFVDDGGVTAPGLIVGSPQYVSPERARNGASTVESDLWSLGATLYAAVEGQSPYARESAMATLAALATEPPDPPVRAGPLAAVLDGLLRYEPAARLTVSETERRLRMIVFSDPQEIPFLPTRRGGRVAAPRPASPPAASSPARPVPSQASSAESVSAQSVSAQSVSSQSTGPWPAEAGSDGSRGSAGVRLHDPATSGRSGESPGPHRGTATVPSNPPAQPRPAPHPRTPPGTSAARVSVPTPSRTAQPRVPEAPPPSVTPSSAGPGAAAPVPEGGPVASSPPAVPSSGAGPVRGLPIVPPRQRRVGSHDDQGAPRLDRPSSPSGPVGAEGKAQGSADRVPGESVASVRADPAASVRGSVSAALPEARKATTDEHHSERPAFGPTSESDQAASPARSLQAGALSQAAVPPAADVPPRAAVPPAAGALSQAAVPPAADVPPWIAVPPPAGTLSPAAVTPSAAVTSPAGHDREAGQESPTRPSRSSEDDLGPPLAPDRRADAALGADAAHALGDGHYSPAQPSSVIGRSPEAAPAEPRMSEIDPEPEVQRHPDRGHGGRPGQFAESDRPAATRAIDVTSEGGSAIRSYELVPMTAIDPLPGTARETAVEGSKSPDPQTSPTRTATARSIRPPGQELVPFHAPPSRRKRSIRVTRARLAVTGLVVLFLVGSLLAGYVAELTAARPQVFVPSPLSTDTNQDPPDTATSNPAPNSSPLGPPALTGAPPAPDTSVGNPQIPPTPSGTATSAAFSPSLCDSPPPGDLPVTPLDDAARGVNGWDLQAGWSYFTDGSGFHIALPDGWTHQRIGTTHCFRATRSTRTITLDTAGDPAADQVTVARAEESRLATSGGLPGYELVGVTPVPLLHKAADWEYRYQSASGAARHAVFRWFVMGGRAYVLGWTTTEKSWNTDLVKIQLIRGTFYSSRSTSSPPSSVPSPSS
ncbi:protein kinase [Actinoplanes philippinensis]